MDWQSTAWAMGFVAVVLIAANLAGRRPRRLGRVAPVPADVVQLVGLILFLLLAAHLLNELTGRVVPAARP